MPNTSRHRLSPKTSPQAPSSSRPGRQRCSALIVPSASDPARAPASRTASAPTISRCDTAGPLASAREADEEGSKKTMRGGIAERHREWQGTSSLPPSALSTSLISVAAVFDSGSLAAPSPTLSLPISPQQTPSPSPIVGTPDHSSLAPAPSSVSSPPPPHLNRLRRCMRGLRQKMCRTLRLRALSPPRRPLLNRLRCRELRPRMPRQLLRRRSLPARLLRLPAPGSHRLPQMCNRHYNYLWYTHCFMCNRT